MDRPIVALLVAATLALAGCLSTSPSGPDSQPTTGGTDSLSQSDQVTPGSAGASAGNATAAPVVLDWSGTISVGAGASGVGSVSGPGSQSVKEFTPELKASAARLEVAWSAASPTAQTLLVEIGDPSQTDDVGAPRHIKSAEGASPLIIELSGDELLAQSYLVRVFVAGSPAGATASQAFTATFTFTPDA